MHRPPALRLRLAELAQMRRECKAQGKPRLVQFIDRLTADIEREIAAIEQPSTAAERPHLVGCLRKQTSAQLSNLEG